MKIWANIFRTIILVIGIIVIAFNAQLYVYCKQQRAELDSMRDKLDAESEFNSNKFKYQQDQIDHLSKDLQDAQQQVKGQEDALADQKGALADQKDTLLQEVEKIQQVESDSKYLQTSLVDIKAEADAIKQDMKGWQRDYVTVLAGLEKKMDDSQYEIKAFEANLTALNIPELKENINSLKSELETINHPPDNSSSVTPPPAPEKKIDHEEFNSQF